MYAAMDKSLRVSACYTYAVCATRTANTCGWAMLTNLSDEHIVRVGSGWRQVLVFRRDTVVAEGQGQAEGGKL